jgi:hypothetical protein
VPEWLIYLLVTALALVVVLAGLGWLTWGTCKWLDARRERRQEVARRTVLARIAVSHTELLGGEAVIPDGGLPAEVPQSERPPPWKPSPVRRVPANQPNGRHARLPVAGNGGVPDRPSWTAPISHGS